jgi:hypothetical protein
MPAVEPKSGSSASIGMTARSWNSSTAKVAWPPRVPNPPRSVSGCSANAVEESASAMPMTTPIRGSTPNAHATAAIPAIDSASCDSPRRDELPAHPQRRLAPAQSDHEQQEHHADLGERAHVLDLSTRLSPHGPIAMPASR